MLSLPESMPPRSPSELSNKVLVNPEVNPLDPLSLDELDVLCLGAIGPFTTPIDDSPKNIMTAKTKTPRITPITMPAISPSDKPEIIFKMFAAKIKQLNSVIC